MLEDESKTNHLVFTGNPVLWMLSLNSSLGLHVPEGSMCSSKAVLELEVEVIPRHIGRPELQLDLGLGREVKWIFVQAAKFDLSNSIVRASSDTIVHSGNGFSQFSVSEPSLASPPGNFGLREVIWQTFTLHAVHTSELLSWM